MSKIYKKSLILFYKMPVNPGIQYQKAEEEYAHARTTSEKLTALQNMYRTAPKHKSSEKLMQEIKNKISKLKGVQEKERQQKKGYQIAVKKEGAAQIVLVGTTNTGKSTLLKKLTGARVEIADYPFTTKKPEVGIMDYEGIKLQIVEIPAVIKNFDETENGATFLGIVRQADLIILMFNKPSEKKLIDDELRKNGIDIPVMIYNNQGSIGDEMWKRLGLIKIYTKEPGKKPSYPPFTVDKGSTVRDMASHVHKDFITKFKFARVFGKSAKFDGAQVGLNHKLKDEDIVELHMK